MINPVIMCRQHLLGEYREMFTLIGHLKHKRQIKGYIAKNCLEPTSIEKRYNELKQEMLNRNYKINKQFVFTPDLLNHLDEHSKNYKVDVEASLIDLSNRCKNCKQNIK